MQVSATPLALGTRRTAGGWIRSPLWDGFWILNTLWIAPIVWYCEYRDPDTYHGPVHLFEMILAVCFWVGHRFSSTYLAYFTTAYRPLLKSQRTRFVWVPLGIALATFAFLVPGDDALPWPRTTRIMYLVILDYGLITYHFAAQHFGFLSLYRLRSGRPASMLDRRLDRAYALIVGGLMVFVAELMLARVFYQEVWLDPVLDPQWLESVFAQVQVGSTVFVALAAAVLLVREVLSGHRSLPRALYILIVAGTVMAAFHLRPFLFILLWTTQHWIAAMGLSTVVAQGNDDSTTSRWYSLWQGFSRRPWLLALLLIAVSAVLLPIMEVEALGPEDQGIAQALVPQIADALANSPWVPVLIAVGFITAFLHYALDRAVFRLSNPEVRQAAKGLFD